MAGKKKKKFEPFSISLGNDSIEPTVLGFEIISYIKINVWLPFKTDSRFYIYAVPVTPCTEHRSHFTHSWRGTRHLFQTTTILQNHLRKHSVRVQHPQGSTGRGERSLRKANCNLSTWNLARIFRSRSPFHFFPLKIIVPLT